MFKIRWRNRNPDRCGIISMRIIDGISRYTSQEAAEKQVAIWKQFFPQNLYYVEPS